MDRVGLTILEQELQADASVMAEAAELAFERLTDEHPGHLAACGYELNRFYNVLEKSFERLCEAFENQIDKSGEYHQRLLERVTLDLPGIRPKFMPVEFRRAVRDLKGFRHFFRHAYDPILRHDRLTELVGAARQVAHEFPDWIRGFCSTVAAELGE